MAMGMRNSLNRGEVFEVAAVIFAHLEDGGVLALEVDGDNTASTTRKPTAAKVISHSRNLTDEEFNQTSKNIASFGARYARGNRGE